LKRKLDSFMTPDDRPPYGLAERQPAPDPSRCAPEVVILLHRIASSFPRIP
jgi:hypothetical protein